MDLNGGSCDVLTLGQAIARTHELSVEKQEEIDYIVAFQGCISSVKSFWHLVFGGPRGSMHQLVLCPGIERGVNHLVLDVEALGGEAEDIKALGGASVGIWHGGFTVNSELPGNPQVFHNSERRPQLENYDYKAFISSFNILLANALQALGKLPGSMRGDISA